MSHLYVPFTNMAYKRVPPDPWEPVRHLITRLYFDEGKTLPEVKETMAQVYNHCGTDKQYKGHIKKWNLDKKHKERDMRAIVHQKCQRDAVGKASAFSVRGRLVTVAEVFKYFRRKGVLDPEAEVGPVDDVPEAVRCWTPSPGEQPELTELDASLERFDEQPLESSHAEEFGTTELRSTAGATVQSQRTSTVNLTRWLLSLSPEIATLEMPSPLLPPETLLIPERLVFEIKAFYEGSFANGEFFSDDRGQLIHISENTGAFDRLDEFDSLCVTAVSLIGKGSALEGRRLLSKVFTLVKDMIRGQNPGTLDCIISVVLFMLRKELPEIGTHLLKYTSEMAAYLLPVTNPLSQILFLIGTSQDSDLKPLLDIAWSCTVDTLKNVYGPFHRYALVCQNSYTIENFEPKAASRLLLGLLQKAEQEMDRLDWRLEFLRLKYGECLYRQGRYAEVIPVLEMVDESSSLYTDTLEVLAWCNYRMDVMHEAEMNIRKSIELNKIHDINDGGDGLKTLFYMDTLYGWLDKWGRIEELEILRVAIRDMTELEGIDEI